MPSWRRLIEWKKALEKKNAEKKERSLEEALGELPENLAHFIRMQLNLHRKKAKGKRYSPRMKSIVVSWYHASEKAYRMLSKLFILPTKASFGKYISKMPAATEISQGPLNTIKRKVDNMSKSEKLCP